MSAEVTEPTRLVPPIIDLALLGAFEVIRTQYTYLTYLLSCRREVERISEKETSCGGKGGDEKTGGAYLPLAILRRQGLRGIALSVLPTVVGRVAIRANATVVGLLFNLLPPQMAPASFGMSMVFLSVVNACMVPSIAPATMLNVKYYGRLPADGKSPSMLAILRAVPVRSWYSGSWMIVAADVAKQVTLRGLAFAFDGLISRLIGPSRLILFTSIFMVGQAMVYPLQLMHTRYVMALGTQSEYKGMGDVCRTMWAKGGLGAFYDGFFLSGLASFLSFVVQ